MIVQNPMKMSPRDFAGWAISEAVRHGAITNAEVSERLDAIDAAPPAERDDLVEQFLTCYRQRVRTKHRQEKRDGKKRRRARAKVARARLKSPR